jgi:flagellar motor switch protein FliG
MTISVDPLRKVAIVLASLDVETADALIEQMPTDRARQVRQALIELRDIDPGEHASVVNEFLRQGYATRRADLAGVELEVGLAERLNKADSDEDNSLPAEAAQGPVALAAEPNSGGSDDDGFPFAFLHELPADELAAHLEHERPQTLAVVFAYLPSDRSAELLGRLPSHTQAEVLRRVAELGELDPQMVYEVERGLRQRIAEQTTLSRPRHRGPKAVVSIVKAAGAEARRQILESLATHQPELAARFAPPPVAEVHLPFDDLSHLSELALAKIFAECDADVLILALAGAHPSFARRVLDQLPSREARLLRKQLGGLGPTSLADVERAQGDVVAAAQRLHAEGRIELAARRSLSLTI